MMLPSLPVLLVALSPPATQAPMLVGAQPPVLPVRRIYAGDVTTAAATTFEEIAPTQSADLQAFEKLTVMSAPERHPEVAVQLRNYLGFPQGWDGDHGLPANPQAVDDALRFLRALPGDLPPPTPMIEPSGSVGLYWLRGEVYAEVGFDGTRVCYLFAEAPGMESIHRDDMPLNDPCLHEDLRQALSREYVKAP